MLVENFVIREMQPFLVIRQDESVQLLKSLVPNKEPLTGCMLVDRRTRLHILEATETVPAN